jgi:hypothetical protein
MSSSSKQEHSSAPTPSFTERLRRALHVLRSGELPSVGRGARWSDHSSLVPSLSAEEVEEAQSFFPMTKFFIFGHARSGTTMLVRLLRIHPQVHCNYQAHFFTRPPLLQALVADTDVRAWLSRPSNRWNRGKDLSPVVLRAMADYILERDARQAGKTIVGDKSPNSLLNGEAVRLMHAVYPDARLIYIIRDGRDAAISHKIQSFIDFPDQLSKEDLKIRTELIRDSQPFLNGDRSLFTERGIHNAAEGWVRNVQETDTLGKELYSLPRCLTNQYYSLRYEDLLDNPWEQMSQLWAFLGADALLPELKDKLGNEMQQNPDAEYQQQKSREISEILKKGKRGSGRVLLTTRDQQIFQEIAGETLKAWGYQ